mgnify:CR=1 FL=1
MDRLSRRCCMVWVLVCLVVTTTRELHDSRAGGGVLFVHDGRVFAYRAFVRRPCYSGGTRTCTLIIPS